MDKAGQLAPGSHAMKRVVLACGLFLFICSGVTSAPHAAEPAAFTAAAIPRHPTAVLAGGWQAFLKQLGTAVGHPFHLKVYESYESFETALLGEEVDLAYVNPYQATKAVDRGYIPLVRDSSDLVGILVVLKDSGVNRLADLNGKTIAFPSPGAFVSSWYLQSLLSRKENIAFTPIYAKTHANVYRTVALGHADAGGGALNTFTDEPENLRELLRILYQTPPTASHPIMVHKRVPAHMRERIRSAILLMAQDEKGKVLLRGINMPNPVVADYKKDYARLKQLPSTAGREMKDREKGPTTRRDASR